MTKINILGAGGHCRSLIALLLQNKIQIQGIYDPSFAKPETILGFPIVGKLNEIPLSEKLVLAVGDNNQREILFKQFEKCIWQKNIFHPSSIVEQFQTIGIANSIFARVYINANVIIGNNNIINTAAILEHDVIIGSHNHISVSSVILGRAKIGDRCFIGASAVIRDKISICSDVNIGANSFVSKDISTPGVYVGSPARKVK